VSDEEVPIGDKAEGTDICMVCHFTPDKCICSGPRTSEQRVADAIEQCEYWIEHIPENLTYAEQVRVFRHLMTVCEAKARHAQEMDEACE
jgi:hypothetical protein